MAVNAMADGQLLNICGGRFCTSEVHRMLHYLRFKASCVITMGVATSIDGIYLASLLCKTVGIMPYHTPHALKGHT